MAKAKKNYFGGVLGLFPQNETLFEKFDLVNFLLLRAPNFMQNYRKTLQAVFEGKQSLKYY